MGAQPHPMFMYPGGMPGATGAAAAQPQQPPQSQQQPQQQQQQTAAQHLAAAHHVAAAQHMAAAHHAALMNPAAAAAQMGAVAAQHQQQQQHQAMWQQAVMQGSAPGMAMPGMPYGYHLPGGGFIPAGAPPHFDVAAFAANFGAPHGAAAAGPHVPGSMVPRTSFDGLGPSPAQLMAACGPFMGSGVFAPHAHAAPAPTPQGSPQLPPAAGAAPRASDAAPPHVARG